jgi:hypothetical protein
MPKPLVTKGNKLFVFSHLLQRLSLKGYVVPPDVASYAGLQNEESTVDPSFADLGLFLET